MFVVQGDVFSLSVFGTTIVVLNSAKAATELFDKRSTIYSDRVCPPMLGEPSLYVLPGDTMHPAPNRVW